MDSVASAQAIPKADGHAAYEPTSPTSIQTEPPVDPTAPPIPAGKAVGDLSSSDRRNGVRKSDQFPEPPDAEGEFIRKTYAHFAAAGVTDDGFTEGKEYTRERRGLSAWEEAALSPTSSAHSILRGSSQQSPSIRQSRSTSFRQVKQSPSSPQFNTGVHANGKGIEYSPKMQSAVDQEGSSDAVSASNASAFVERHTVGRDQAASAQVVPVSSESTLPRTTFLSGDEWQRRQDAAEQKRQELTAKIDRYGFFSDPISIGYHRSVLLRAELFNAPFPRKGATNIADKGLPKIASLTSSLDQNCSTPTQKTASGSTRSVAAARAESDEAHRRKEKSRIAKWKRMLSVESRDEGYNATSYTFVSDLSAKRLRRRVIKGIPDIWRSAAWKALLRRQEGSETSEKPQPAAAPSQQFASLVEQPSPHDVQIDLDVPRTISGHIQFHTRYGQGQRDLFHVLHDLSLLCSKCGYCQGMGPIVATFLCYFPPEQVYALMVIAHNDMGLHNTFRPGFPGLVENLYIQDQLVKHYMPEMYAVFKDQMISTSAYATKWYITLFSNSMPFETQLRIWDAWLLEGSDVITLSALSILWALRATILDPQADFETILGALSSYFVPENDDSILLWVGQALKRKDVRKMITDAGAEYRLKVENGDPVDML